MKPNQANTMSTAELRRASERDTVGHSSVQPWSAGELFPAVIAVTERYRTEPTAAELFTYGTAELWMAHASLESRLVSRSFTLLLDGRAEEYASLDDAETVARALLANPEARAGWARVADAVARERAPVKHGAGPTYGAGFYAYTRRP